MGFKSFMLGGALATGLLMYGTAEMPDVSGTFDGLFKSEDVAALEVDLMAEELKRSELDTQIKSLDYQLAERKTRLEIVALERQIGEAEIQLEVDRQMADERIAHSLDRAYVTSQVWLVIEAAWLLIAGLVAPLVAIVGFIWRGIRAYGRYKEAKSAYD